MINIKYQFGIDQWLITFDGTTPSCQQHYTILVWEVAKWFCFGFLWVSNEILLDCSNTTWKLVLGARPLIKHSHICLPNTHLKCWRILPWPMIRYFPHVFLPTHSTCLEIHFSNHQYSIWERSLIVVTQLYRAGPHANV